MTIAVRPLPVLTEDGKTAAYIHEGHIFRKQLLSKNMLQSPRGWSISENLVIEGRPVKFAELPRYGVDIIQVAVTDTNQLYVVAFRKFTENCIPVNRGTGPHKALALPFWTGPLRWK